MKYPDILLNIYFSC